MNAYARLLDGKWTIIDEGGFTVGSGDEAISYPRIVLDVWTADQLAEIGVYAVQPAASYNAAAYRVLGTTIEDNGVGRPIYVNDLAVTPLADRKEGVLEAIRAARYAHEQGGFTTGQGRMRSDDVTQAKITGAVSLFSLDPTLMSLDWELAPGVFASVSAAQVQDMGILIGRHVQACFTRSRQLTEAVLAASTHAELSAIDLENGWPA